MARELTHRTTQRSSKENQGAHEGKSRDDCDPRAGHKRAEDVKPVTVCIQQPVAVASSPVAHDEKHTAKDERQSRVAPGNGYAACNTGNSRDQHSQEQQN